MKVGAGLLARARGPGLRNAEPGVGRRRCAGKLRATSGARGGGPLGGGGGAEGGMGQREPDPGAHAGNKNTPATLLPPLQAGVPVGVFWTSGTPAVSRDGLVTCRAEKKTL